MAKQIPSPFGPWNGSGITWADLFNGKAWEIKRGEDFELAASTVTAYIRAEHQRLYGGLNIKEEGDIIRIERIAGVLESQPQSFRGRVVASEDFRRYWRAGADLVGGKTKPENGKTEEPPAA